MNTLYVLCGCPGAGKTTWARRNLNNNHTCYISRDEIRFRLLNDNDDYFAKENDVYNTFVAKIAANLKVRNVVADATHISNCSRKKLLSSIAKITPKFEVIYITFPVEIDMCLARNARREGRAQVPESVVRRMYINFQPPMFDEDSRIKGIWTINEKERESV